MPRSLRRRSLRIPAAPWWVGVCSAGLLAGCDSSSPSDDALPNQDPAITRLSATRVTLETGSSTRLEAFATDPDGDPLTYGWTSASGSFSDPTAAASDWTAPSSPGTATVTCTVQDGQGGAASLTLTLSVVAPDGDRDGDGISAADGDCDDADATVYPGGLELPDGLDNDCDGSVDEGLDLYDDDGDGFAPVDGDCDDADPAVHPGAADPADGIDNDCDGVIDEGTSTSDDDQDGYSEAEGDCDDVRPDVYPGAGELPDTADNDCDGVIDEDTVLTDDDGDGFTELEGDCDDADPARSPAALEAANGVDDDCDDQVDEGTPAQDLDGDGVSMGEGDCDDVDAAVYPGAPEAADAADNDCDGVIDEGTLVYDDDGDGYTDAVGDCDDGRAAVYPGAAEAADGLDNDCDALIDEGTLIYDDDGDGYTDDAGDCDDLDVRARPDYPEVPDGIDNDCDGLTDEATVLADLDGDGFDVGEGDCDDGDPATYPGAIDLPDDGKDNDCGDVAIDQPPVASTAVVGATSGCGSLLLDGSASADPEGSALSYQWYVIEGPGTASVSAATTAATAFSWDGDGLWRVGLAVSDGVLTGAEAVLELDTEALRVSICELDADGDGVSAVDGDCDDGDPAVYPGAVEVCDGIDQNCDGTEVLFDETFDTFDSSRWALYGDAYAGAGDVVLTGIAGEETGSLFYRMPLELERFSVYFEVLLEGGSAGDGMTFAVIDAEEESFLGAGEGGLGLLGLNGWGVELDTHVDPAYGDPNYHHVALVRAEDLAAAGSSRASIRNATNYVEVRYDLGTITVLRSDVQILSFTPDWVLPERGYLGFTAATDMVNTDYHHVQRVRYSCE